jgi:nucleoid-associated protein YgaU
MTIHIGSRYRFRNTSQIVDQDGKAYLIHRIRKTTVNPQSGFRLYTTIAGDTFEKLAEREYGDARKWYVIADSNPEVFFPLDLDSGVQIIIPPRSFAVVS